MVACTCNVSAKDWTQVVLWFVVSGLNAKYLLLDYGVRSFALQLVVLSGEAGSNKTAAVALEGERFDPALVPA